MPATTTTLAPGGVNAIGRMLGLLGDEWNLLILQQALMGASRYRHFIDRLPISNAVLTSRLRTLCDADLLTRRRDGTGAQRAEYLPTPRSRSLWPVLVCIWEWERTWVAEHTEGLPVMRHRDCRQDFSPLLRCTRCYTGVSIGEVDFHPGPSGSWDRSAPSAATRRRAEREPVQGQAGLFAETMSVFGNRWAAALLLAAFLGTSRFTDFQAQLGAPASVLSERLQTFCAIGILRVAPASAADRTAYLLTDKGGALIAVLVTALQWAQRWFRAPEGPALELVHHGCAAALRAELACGRCGERLRGADVDVIAAQPDATSWNPRMIVSESLT